MLELNYYQNMNTESKNYGMYYVRKEPKQVMDLTALAEHMAEHNTPFSKGTIQGILTDMVGCIRELALNGMTIKIPNLALFSCSVESTGCDSPGELKAALTDSGGQVRNVKLLAQSTGEFTRAELNRDVRFTFTSKAQAGIDAWKAQNQPQPQP
jgi:hypothetical protein